jgi:hypothetical protein
LTMTSNIRTQTQGLWTRSALRRVRLLACTGILVVTGCAGGPVDADATDDAPTSNAVNLAEGGAAGVDDNIGGSGGSKELVSEEETGVEQETASKQIRVTGCTIYSSVSLIAVTIPSGVFCFSIGGSASPKGHGATFLQGDWTAANASNWRIDWVSYDRNGKVWWKEVGPTHWTTTVGGGKRTRTDAKGWLTYGETCAEFYQNSRFIDRACLSITP